VTRDLRFGDDAAPNFRLVIDGKVVDSGHPLARLMARYGTGIIWEENIELATKMELTVANPGARFSDSLFLLEGSYCDVWMGYGSRLRYMGRVELVKHIPFFPPAGGIPMLAVTGYDARHRMIENKREPGQRRRKIVHTGMDQHIAARVAAKHGIQHDVDTVEHRGNVNELKRVQPAEMSDWQFIQKLAELNAFDAWVDYVKGGTNAWMLHFLQRDSWGTATPAPDTYRFAWSETGGSLLSCRFRLSVENQSTEVEVVRFDRKDHQLVAIELKEVRPSEEGSFATARPGDFEVRESAQRGSRVRLRAFGRTVDVIADRRVKTKKEAESIARKWFADREDDFVVAEGALVGLEDLRPRQIHRLEGVGTRLSGDYRLSMTRHTMVPGQIFGTEFVASKVLKGEVGVSRWQAAPRVTSIEYREGE
jgi:phage protein D